MLNMLECRGAWGVRLGGGNFSTHLQHLEHFPGNVQVLVFAASLAFPLFQAFIAEKVLKTGKMLKIGTATGLQL